VPGYIVYGTPAGALMAVPFDASARKVTGSPALLDDNLSVDFSLLDIAVSQTGTLLYVSGARTGSSRSVVWVARDGHESAIDTSWRAGFSDPAAAPDGKRFAITMGQALVDAPTRAELSSDVWIRRLDDGALTKLSVEGGGNRYPTWSADGKFVLYVSGVNGETILEKPADGSAPPVVRVRGP